MKLRILTTALVALAGAFFTAQSAKAQYTLGQPEDMILSFYAGGSVDIQVDLGNATQFTAATPTFASINLNTDLTNQFGSNWFSNSSLEWSVAGINTGAALDGFNKDSTFVTDDTGALFGNKTGSQLASSTISQLYSPVSGDYTAGVAANTDIYAVPNTNSYAAANATAGFNIFGDTEGTFGTGVVGGVSSLQLDVYTAASSTLSNAPQALLTNGLFSINSAGIVSYGAAVPEPSTYALMLVGALLLAYQVRRKSSAAFKL